MPLLALIIGALVVIADQIIKYFIVTCLKPVGTVTVIDGLFNLTYVENRGVAFGMFQDMRVLFIVLTSLFIFAIVFYMFKNRPEGRLFYVLAGLIIGGGVVNLIDRIIYGYVIDYLSLSFFPPVCNFADYCITVGVAVLAVYYFVKSAGKDKKKVKKND